MLILIEIPGKLLPNFQPWYIEFNILTYMYNGILRTINYEYFYRLRVFQNVLDVLLDALRNISVVVLMRKVLCINNPYVLSLSVCWRWNKWKGVPVHPQRAWFSSIYFNSLKTEKNYICTRQNRKYYTFLVWGSTPGPGLI